MADSQVLKIHPRDDTSHPTTPVNDNPPPIQQTPVVFKSATQEYTMNIPLADDAYDALGAETRGQYLVGMKPERFMNEFLPWNSDTPLVYKEQRPDPSRIQSLKSVPSTATQQKESTMYSKYIEALDGWVTGIDTNQKLRFEHFARPDRNCGSMNVDVSTYWQDDFATISGSCTFSLHQTHEEFKSSISHDAFTHESDDGPGIVEAIAEGAYGVDASKEAAGDTALDGPSKGGTQLPTVDINSSDPVELIEEGEPVSPSLEPVKAVKEPQASQIKEEKQQQVPPSLLCKVEPDTQASNHTLRGQIAAYAGVAMSMAFRSHFFSLLILGQYARLIRWDRRGAIVTRRFDYAANPHIIFNFYLRFGQLSPRQRGFDTNVEPIKDGLPPRVAKAFNKYYHKSWHEGAKYGHKTDQTNLVSASEMSFFRIQIEDRAQSRVESFIIPSPVFKRSYMTPFARASRRCLAYFDDAVAPKMCFLKDSWQEISQRTAPEADIYRLLHSKNVPNLASMRLGDDVADLETVTQNWFYTSSHSGRYKHLGAMVCHRLVLDTVARDLSTFTWCKVLLKCLADAVDAAQEAYKAGVLHRDISAGNIMIAVDEKTQELRGILIDWDMCLLLKQRNAGIARTARTGTWAFISARLLASANSSIPVVHSLSDDMESVFWVLFYQVLRYTRHSKTGDELYQLLKSLFDDAAKGNRGMVGGQAKMWALEVASNANSIKRLTKFDRVELENVLHELGYLFNSPYALSEQEAEERKVPNPRGKAQETKGNKPTIADHDDDDEDDDDDDDDDNEDKDDSDKDDEDDQEDSDEEPHHPLVTIVPGGTPVNKPVLIRKDLNDPNEKLLSEYLRQAAHFMEPMGVTPSGLLSPKQNSRPPKNSARWKRALPKHYAADFYHMWFVKDSNDTASAQTRQISKVTSSMVNRMDGLSFSSGSAKRPIEDDDEEQEGRTSTKRRRPAF